MHLIQVAKAEETAAQIDVELKALQSTLENIESARPFEDLTVCILILRLRASFALHKALILTYPYDRPKMLAGLILKSEKLSTLWSRRANGPYLVSLLYGISLVCTLPCC